VEQEIPRILGRRELDDFENPAHRDAICVALLDGSQVEVGSNTPRHNIPLLGERYGEGASPWWRAGALVAERRNSGQESHSDCDAYRIRTHAVPPNDCR
jgi:hypothetical protein